MGAGPSASSKEALPAFAEERFSRLFVVGEGSAAVVEAALERTPEGDRVVALKRIAKTSADGARRREMFAREARLAVLVRDPRVVRTYAYGESDASFVLVMEHVAGAPLGTLLAALRSRGRTLAPPLVVHVLAELCAALGAVHGLCDEDGTPLGVVHRDVSPANVMVATDGTLKLLDLGVAKANIVDGATRAGEVKGKLAYMAPEQAFGDPVDARADLYSVGAILFECLTGAPPFAGESDVGILRRLSEGERPTLAGPGPGADDALVALAHRLLATAPTDRFASARDAEAALRGWLAAHPADPPEATLACLVAELFGQDLEAERSRLDASLTALVPTPAEGADAWRRTLTMPFPIVRASASPDEVVGRATVPWPGLPNDGAMAPATPMRGSATASPWSERQALEDKLTVAVPVVREAQPVLATPLALARDRTSLAEVERASKDRGATPTTRAVPHASFRRWAWVFLIVGAIAAAYVAGRSEPPPHDAPHDAPATR